MLWNNTQVYRLTSIDLSAKGVAACRACLPLLNEVGQLMLEVQGTKKGVLGLNTPEFLATTTQQLIRPLVFTFSLGAGLGRVTLTNGAGTWKCFVPRDHVGISLCIANKVMLDNYGQ